MRPLVMLTRIPNARDNVRCTCCGSPARFYDDDAKVFHCCDCASFLAEKLIEILARIYLLLAKPASPLVQ